jgi:hypothetical protein
MIDVKCRGGGSSSPLSSIGWLAFRGSALTTP